MFRLLLGVCALTLFACSPNNVDIDNSLEKHFTETKTVGTFALLNNSTGRFTIYNLKRYRDSAYLPASTFKILNSLIGLQTGKITSDSMTIDWDGRSRRPEWDRNLTMYEAFRVSAVPYFQEVARRIGRDTMQFWLDSVKYGSRRITTAVDTFWLDNSMKITPDEQLGLVKRLYFNQLPFYRIHHETVKRAMLMEDKPEYRLSYKTGLGFRENGNQLGWVVGFIEENKHPYLFVLNLESPDRNLDLATVRLQVLKGILDQLGFLKGKK